MSWSLGGGLWTPCHGDLTQLVNSRLCVLILSLLAATHLLLVTVYFPAPIRCFCPSHMTASDVAAIHAICLTGTHMYQLAEDTIPTRYEDRTAFLTVTSYYQYVGMILVIQAILFYIPSIVWREFARKVGILPEELALSAVKARHTNNATDRESSVRLLAKHVQSFCTRHLRRRHVSYAFWWFHGNKLVLVQIVSKLLYGANVVGQFFLLDAFLGMPFHDYGWQLLGRVPGFFNLEILRALLRMDVEHLNPEEAILNNYTKSALESYLEDVAGNKGLYFPQNVYCNAALRRLGNIQRYTVQCVLPYNALNHIVFKFDWFLLFTVSIVTFAALVHAVFRFVFFACHRMSIRERLQDQAVLDSLDPREEDTIREVTAFERDFLQRDGFLLIDYIESAAGDVIADDVIKYLWEFYKENSADLMAITKRVKWTEEVDDQVEFREEPTQDDYTAVAMDTRGACGEQPPPYEGLDSSVDK